MAKADDEFIQWRKPKQWRKRIVDGKPAWWRRLIIDGKPVWVHWPGDWSARASALPPKKKHKPRSRKPRENRGGGPQRLRARVVLRRIWRQEYPTREVVSDADVWDRFSEAYDRIEGKANPPSKHGKPSLETVLREMGRRD